MISDRNDGHQYIPELISKGVRNFIVSDSSLIQDEANYILVDNTLTALQKLASYHRSKFDYPVIGITGSNGKTIIKEWLYQLLHEDYNIVRSPKSFNSQIGVPLSILQMEKQHNLGIFEAGISLPNEMEQLERIIQPDIGIISNIGEAHAAGFNSIDEKLSQKLALFKNTKTLVYCKDHSLISKELDSVPEENKVSWGENRSSEMRILNLEWLQNSTKAHIEYQSNSFELDIPFYDKASVENVFHCVCLMLFLNIPVVSIIHRVSKLHSIEMRLFQKEAIHNCLLINDYYNSDFNSLELALDFTLRQHRGGALSVILSDIYQSELSDEELYTKVASLLKSKEVNRIFGIGKSLSQFKHLFSDLEGKFFLDTNHFLNTYSEDWFRDETILLKGARSFSFEKISQKLDKKIHRTVLEINLNSLSENINTIRKKLNPETKLMAMVKAHSYGSGSHQIAKLLESKNVNYLAVAYTQEGVSLRKDGITTPIMVMTPEADNLGQLLDYNLEANIYSYKMFDALVDCIRDSAHISTGIHLEFNTGMARLGFEASDVEKLVSRLKSEESIKLLSVFSHLAAADEESHKGFTIEQCEQFKSISTQFKQEFGNQVIAHILNSAGAIVYPKFQMDMIRLGIALYGINPAEQSNLKLSNVYTLKSYISQIRFVAAKASVGYGRKSIADIDRRVAIIPIGYADGLNRLLSNGVGSMKIKGLDAPIVGNICMDMTMVDVTNINCEEGDEVIIFERGEEVEEIAKNIGTISYEVLTSISERVTRVFVEE